VPKHDKKDVQGDVNKKHTTPLSEVKEAAAFIGSGAAAIVEFFAGDHEQADEAKIEAGGSQDQDLVDKLDDMVANVGRKIAPFPGQDG
jgi:hypothetical protein